MLHINFNNNQWCWCLRNISNKSHQIESIFSINHQPRDLDNFLNALHQSFAQIINTRAEWSLPEHVCKAQDDWIQSRCDATCQINWLHCTTVSVDSRIAGNVHSPPIAEFPPIRYIRPHSRSSKSKVHAAHTSSTCRCYAGYTYCAAAASCVW